jgi:hypothetical protein
VLSLQWASVKLDLSDEETFALINLLTEVIEADRYPPSPRVETLRAILAKFGPMRSAPARYLLQIASNGEWKAVAYLNDLKEARRTIAKAPNARVFDTWRQEPLNSPLTKA